MFTAAAGWAQPVALLEETQFLERVEASTNWGDLLQARTDAARSEGLRATIWTNPHVGAEHEQFFSGEDEASESTLWVSQVFDISGRRAHLAAAAGHGARGLGFEANALREARRRELRVLFAQTMYFQQRVAAHEALIAELEELQITANARRDLGDISALDALRIELDVERSIAHRERDALRRDAGWAQMEALTATKSPAGPWPRLAGELWTTGASTTAASIDEHPLLGAEAARADAAERRAQAAARGWIPAVELTVGLKRAGHFDGAAFGLLLGFSLPVALFDRGQADELAARAQLAHAKWQRATTHNALAADLEAARVVEGRLKSIGPGLQANRERAERIVRLSRAFYEAGEGDIRGLLDAFRARSDVELDFLEVGLELRQARIVIESLVFRSTP
ncbi:MAG: TolC family protein [Bradymonadaceae bacterium]|nr:TolC family protein [Lujinxingiaceae bacterium]